MRYVSGKFNMARKADGLQPPLRLALEGYGEITYETPAINSLYGSAISCSPRPSEGRDLRHRKRCMAAKRSTACGH